MLRLSPTRSAWCTCSDRCNTVRYTVCLCGNSGHRRWLDARMSDLATVLSTKGKETRAVHRSNYGSLRKTVWPRGYARGRVQHGCTAQQPCMGFCSSNGPSSCHVSSCVLERRLQYTRSPSQSLESGSLTMRLIAPTRASVSQAGPRLGGNAVDRSDAAQQTARHRPRVADPSTCHASQDDSCAEHPSRRNVLLYASTVTLALSQVCPPFSTS